MECSECGKKTIGKWKLRGNSICWDCYKKLTNKEVKISNFDGFTGIKKEQPKVIDPESGMTFKEALGGGLLILFFTLLFILVMTIIFHYADRLIFGG